MPLRPATLVALALLTATAGSAGAQGYAYSDLDLDACEVERTYEEGGGADLRCEGYGGFDVFVSEGDARTDVDFGVRNDAFETFSAFNGIGTTVEWMTTDNGVEAATIRFLIDVDGRSAQALVVSRVGVRGAPGCVVAVVDAAVEQANGVARGLAAMAPFFDCARDTIVIVPGARELVRDFSGARQ